MELITSVEDCTRWVTPEKEVFRGDVANIDVANDYTNVIVVYEYLGELYYAVGPMPGPKSIAGHFDEPEHEGAAATSESNDRLSVNDETHASDSGLAGNVGIMNDSANLA